MFVFFVIFMTVPLSESWKIAKSELVCVAIYYFELVYIFTAIWSRNALKRFLLFDLDNSRDMVFNSMPLLPLDYSPWPNSKGCCCFGNKCIDWKGVNKLMLEHFKMSVVFGSLYLLINVEANRFCLIQCV